MLFTVGTMNWGTLQPSSSSFHIFHLLSYLTLKTLRYIYESAQFKQTIYNAQLLYFSKGGDHGGQEW